MPEMPKFLDRELSWLEFNQRVLDRALDERTPLMERLKFLAITGSNLDEFYRVRVGTLKIVLRRGITRVSLSGLNPAEQLAAVQMRAAKMFTDQYACLRELEPLLASEGLRRVTSEGLSGTQQRILRQVFEKEILSVLTPTALVGESFPHLPNELVHLLVRLRPENPREFEGMLEEDGTRYAIVPAAHILTRFFSVPTEQGFAYILVEDLVKHFISELFPGDKIEECVPFRCLRNAEVELQEFSPAGLAWEMEETLQGRSEADWVRLEVAAEASDTLVTVFSRFDGEKVLLEVVDTGPGVSPELQDRIFDPFFTTKDVGQGTGLGLSVSLELVERNGGNLSLRSQVGRGATFSIALPPYVEEEGELLE